MSPATSWLVKLILTLPTMYRKLYNRRGSTVEIVGLSIDKVFSIADDGHPGR